MLEAGKEGRCLGRRAITVGKASLPSSFPKTLLSQFRGPVLVITGLTPEVDREYAKSGPESWPGSGMQFVKALN